MADLLQGNDSEGWEDYCELVYNSIKNHWRQSNPIGNLTGLQEGMIVSDADDNKLYHVTDESPAYDEILQATESFDVIPYFLGVDLWSNAYHHIIRASEAEGLAGADLRIGLDESLRSLIICDRGDIAVDFGISASAEPIVWIMTAAAGRGMKLNSYLIDFLNGNYEISAGASSNITHKPYRAMTFESVADILTGHCFNFQMAADSELTKNNAEQAFVYFAPEIAQTSTAGYIGVLLDVTETTLGDASAGAGYNALMDLRISTVSKFRVENNGDVYVIGDFHTAEYHLTDTVLWSDCFDHGNTVDKYQKNWQITALNTQGAGTNTVDTKPSYITLTTDNNAIGDNEGTRTLYAVIVRARQNRSEIQVELGQTANTQFYFGWNNSATNSMTAGVDEYVIVFFDKSDDDNWQIKVGDAVGEEVFTSAIAADLNDTILEIWVETDGTVHFAIDHVEIDITGSITKQMTASDHYLIVGQAQSVTGAAAIVAEIMYVENEKYKVH